MDWETVEFVRERTDLTVVLKGILHPDDAREAVRRGVDGIVVSNHGGRQVDGAISAIEALPGIVEAVEDEGSTDDGGASDDEFAILFDSGIRRGADAIKAIALGADAVLLGRPYVYGLAIDGETGVREVVKNFLADLDLTLALSGRDSVEGLDEDVLVETDLP
jgi:isopentenyl diphosphate isomerase/L-lactate dehydrogenase-like FMN-dependent dehydrogenase